MVRKNLPVMPNVVFFVQSSDPRNARVAIERAILLKENKAVNKMELIFGGEGTIPLATSSAAEIITRLNYANRVGITMYACGAGLFHNKLTSLDIPEFIPTVPFGILRTMELVRKGYVVMQY